MIERGDYMDRRAAYRPLSPKPGRSALAGYLTPASAPLSRRSSPLARGRVMRPVRNRKRDSPRGTEPSAFGGIGTCPGGRRGLAHELGELVAQISD